jgi:hypothetical protein
VSRLARSEAKPTGGRSKVISKVLADGRGDANYNYGLRGRPPRHLPDESMRTHIHCYALDFGKNKK